MQHPAIRVRRELLGRRLVERDAFALGTRHLRGIPRREEPLLLREELLMHASHGEPARDRFVDRLLRERLPRGAVHHRRRDLVRRNQRVERRRARLRAIRFVEPAVIDRAAAVAHVHERGLRQRGQQLVRRVRREHRRPVLRMVRRVAAHGEPSFVQRIEARVAVPRLVEMNAVDALREPLFDTDRVVAHAVVRAVREHRVDGALLACRFRERVVRNALRDRLRLEPLRRNRADDSVAITASGSRRPGCRP